MLFHGFEKSWCSNTYILQNRFQNKGYIKRQVSKRMNSRWIKDLNIKQTIKLLEDNKCKPRWITLGIVIWHQRYNPWEKEISCSSLKLNISAWKKTVSRELEGKPQMGRIYFQKKHLIKDYFPRYTNPKTQQ